MTFQLSHSLKRYILQFAERYHRYRVDTENLRTVRYRIHSTLADYKTTRTLQLAITDKPGDLLPPLTIAQIKKMPDILAGLHSIDVNSINDLYYLSQDNVTEVRVQGEVLQAIHEDGSTTNYDINETFQHRCMPSKRIAFMIGYMQAEKVMQKAYQPQERYKVIQDNITTLQIHDVEINEQILMSPMDILFSDQYKHFSKEDIARIGYICGQMSQT